MERQVTLQNSVDPFPARLRDRPHRPETHAACASSGIVGGQLGVPGLKFACDLNGYYGGRARLPLLPLTSDQQEEVTRLMADIRY